MYYFESYTVLYKCDILKNNDQITLNWSLGKRIMKQFFPHKLNICYIHNKLQ